MRAFVAYLIVGLFCASGIRLHAQMAAAPKVSISALGEKSYRYSGPQDSVDHFLESINEDYLKGITIDLEGGRVSPGLLFLVQRTVFTVDVTLVGFDELDARLVLSNVLQPERVTDVTLANTTLSTVPEELRRFTSITKLTLDTLISEIPRWVFRDLIMLNHIYMGRGRVRLGRYPIDSSSHSVSVQSLYGLDDTLVNRDSLFQATGIWVETEYKEPMDFSALYINDFKEIDVWSSDKQYVGRMDFNHCSDFGRVMYDQILQCTNNRAPFTDKDPARCTEYLDLIRTKRVLRVDLVPEGVLIEGTFLVTGTQAERLRRFIYCTR